MVISFCDLSLVFSLIFSYINLGESYLFEIENEFHKSSCVELYLQCGVQNDKSNVFIDLVSKILSEPCYNTLRTKVMNFFFN